MKTIMFRKITTLLYFAVLLVCQQSCYRKFYKATEATATSDPATIIKQQSEKYFILRAGTKAYHMENIDLDSADTSIKFTLGRLPYGHTSYLAADKKKGINYKKSIGEDIVLNEVHVYVPADTNMHYLDTCHLDFNKISKIEILEKDKSRTTTSTIISTGVIAASAVALTYGSAFFVVLLLLI